MKLMLFSLAILLQVAGDSLLQNPRTPIKPGPAPISPVVIQKRPEVPAAFKHKIKVVTLQKRILPSSTACHCSSGVRRDVLELIVDFDPPLQPKEKFWFVMECDGGGKASIMGTIFGNCGMMQPIAQQKLMEGETVSATGETEGRELAYALRDKRDAEERIKAIKAGKSYDYPESPGSSRFLWMIQSECQVSAFQATFSRMVADAQPTLKMLKVDGKDIPIPK